MKRGSKEAQVGQWIFAIVACLAAFFEASETARTLFMFAFAFLIAECICKSIEWAAQERSCGNVEIHTTGGGGSGGRLRPQDRTRSDE